MNLFPEYELDRQAQRRRAAQRNEVRFRLAAGLRAERRAERARAIARRLLD